MKAGRVLVLVAVVFSGLFFASAARASTVDYPYTDAAWQVSNSPTYLSGAFRVVGCASLTFSGTSFDFYGATTSAGEDVTFSVDGGSSSSPVSQYGSSAYHVLQYSLSGLSDGSHVFSVCPTDTLVFVSALSVFAPDVPTATPTLTFTFTPSITSTVTLTFTRTPHATSTGHLSSPTPHFTFTALPTRTFTLTRTPSLTRTPTKTRTFTVTRTPTKTRTVTLTRTPTRTPTLTFTPSLTRTPTKTRTVTLTRTPTRTPSPTLTPN